MLAYLLLFFTILGLVGALLLLTLALLEQSLGDQDLVLGWSSPTQIMSVGPLVVALAPSEELRHSRRLALMHSPLSTHCRVDFDQ